MGAGEAGGVSWLKYSIVAKKEREQRMKNRNLFLIILGLGGIMTFACFACLGIGLLANSSSTNSRTVSQATQEIRPVTTIAALPTETPLQQAISQPSAETITPKEVPTATATPREVQGALPGLQAADIKVSLEERGFNCTQAEKFKTANVYVWTCQQETGSFLFRVDIYGETLTTVDYISATALDYSGSNTNLSAEFLGFIATVPYDGAEPTKAREWVSKNILGEQSTTFGQVRYEIYGQPEAKTLTMGIFKW